MQGIWKLEIAYLLSAVVSTWYVIKSSTKWKKLDANYTEK